MPTAFTHGYVSWILGRAIYKEGVPPRFWALSAVCSILPDLDVIGFGFGIRYGDFWGHRGFTHSLLFALLTGLTVASFAFRDVIRFSSKWLGLFAYFFMLTASHGFLDAMTDGGLGIAFFSPFNTTRYFLPWRPLIVSPIGLLSFLTPQGFGAILSEILWVWLPLTLIFFAFGRSSCHR